MRMRDVVFAVAVLGTLPLGLSAVADDSAAKVTTVAVPSGGKPIVARTDKDGAVHLLFDTGDGPKYAKSTDGGVSFSAAIPVVHGGSQPAGLKYDGWDM